MHELLNFNILAIDALSPLGFWQGAPGCIT
jgi:hypothetical protein